MVSENKIRKLDFGCGHNGSEYMDSTLKNKGKLKGYITADLEGADYNFDFNKFPYPFPDNYFDEIFARSSIDHLDDFFGVMKEFHRISKPNAKIVIIGPFYNCATSYMPTHKQHLTFHHFYTLSRTSPTPERGKNFPYKMEIIEFKTISGMFGKLIPDIQFNKTKPGLRYLIGMLLGDVVRSLYVELKVIK